MITFGIIVTQRPFSHRYWLIPGGIVIVPRAIFSQKREFGRVSAADSPLILFSGRTWPGSAHFLHRGSHHQIRASRPELIGLAAGWLSMAAPPSHEQVRAFVNPD